MTGYFAMDACEHGGVYFLHASNLSFGVYITEIQGFVGLRHKLGMNYLFIEYHWDYSVIIGTAQPITLLEHCPHELLADYLQTRDDQHPELFAYLNDIEHRFGNGRK